MIRYILRRLLASLILIFLLSILTFYVIQAPPGDYATHYVARLQAELMSEERRQELLEITVRRYGLDRPVHEQYLLWIGKIVTRGDFGLSFNYDQPVRRILRERLPITVGIGLLVLFFQYVVAVPIAVVTAVKQNSVADYGLTFASFVGMSIPEFLLALVLMVLFFHTFPDWPLGGLLSPEHQNDPGWTVDKVVDLLKHLVVPVIVIGAASTAGTIRVLRAAMLDELGKEYMRVARAKGLTERRLIFKYPLRIAVNPILASVGWSLPIIVSGGVIISIVLDIPDIGPVLFTALLSQDSFLAGAIVFMLSTLTIIGTLISDILLALSDPRIDFSKAQR